MKNTVKRIKRYKEIKADIVDIDIKIQELEEEMLGVSAQPTEERTGKTYKITSSVEQQAEIYMKQKEKKQKEKKRLERELARIDNAMTVLTEDEFDIVKTVHIDNERWWRLEEKYHKSYRALKYIEEDAIKKMEKYLA
jgi:hypothetical protein